MSEEKSLTSRHKAMIAGAAIGSAAIAAALLYANRRKDKGAHQSDPEAADAPPAPKPPETD